MTILDFVASNAALLVALGALGLTIPQAQENRRHARLSVRPYLAFERLVSNEVPQIQILLHNSGTGPAFITSFAVTLDGHPVNNHKSEFWRRLGEQLHIPLIWGGGTYYRGNEAIRAQQTVLLAKFQSTESKRDDAFSNEEAHNQLNRLEIVIGYQSIYGEKFAVRASDA